MSKPNEHLLDCLRDAYAMEKQAESMLKAQSFRLEHYPELRQRMNQHLEETLCQQALLEGCLDRLGHGVTACRRRWSGAEGYHRGGVQQESFYFVKERQHRGSCRGLEA